MSKKRKSLHVCTCGSGFAKGKDLAMHLRYMKNQGFTGHKPIGKAKEKK